MSSRAVPVWVLFSCFLALFTVLLCLVPKPENDLFFILRIGTDILSTRHLPRFDTYSWSCYGTPWVLPEWGAFALYALCFHAGGFFGTWVLMAGVVLATAFVVWGYLGRALPLAWAFAVTCLCLLCLSDFVQERPYVFTYLLLAVSLIVVSCNRGGDGDGRGLWVLVPLCVVWTNLHQGVVSLVGLLFVFAAGDGIAAARERGRSGGLIHARRGWRMAGAGAACGLGSLVTPYGWHVYQNVFVTLRDPQLMANVTEWRPIWVLPVGQMIPFLILFAVSVGVFGRSKVCSLADCLVLAVLVGQAIVHARGVPLFAIGAVIVGAPYFAEGVGRLTAGAINTTPSPLRGPLIAGFGALYVVVFLMVTVAGLKRDAGGRGLSLEGIGEAVARVPDYPWGGCAFMEREGFPVGLRVLNNFEIGGFLMWRLPERRVFVDGRLDVYAGRVFDDNLVLARESGSAAGRRLAERYGVDCVVTTSALQAAGFAGDPSWQLVYVQGARGKRARCRILLRRRREYGALIARCLRGGSGGV